MKIFLLSESLSWHEPTIYRASGVKLFLCGHGKAAEIYQLKVLCECPLVTAARPVARGRSCHGDVLVAKPANRAGAQPDSTSKPAEQFLVFCLN